MSRTTCYLCGHTELELLSGQRNPSLTTDGKRVSLEALNAQCPTCGLMQKLQDHEAIFSHLSYTDTYELYTRPGVKAFDAPRYERYARWVSEIFPAEPSRILEVGCGAGWIIDIVQRLWPAHRFYGLEPAVSACELAQSQGLCVTQGLLGNAYCPPASYDMAYSINVLEHTPDPIAFLRDMASVVKPGGKVIVICPNSDVISSESLYIDHLFSIRQDNLRLMFQRAGLGEVNWQPGLAGAMEDLQMMVGTVGDFDNSLPAEVFSVRTALLQARRDYFASWRQLDAVLAKRLGDAREIVCFGAGETSDLIAMLAPKTWQRVRSYAIDRLNDEKPDTYSGLPLRYVDEVSSTSTVLLGVKQHYQAQLDERLHSRFDHVVRWDDLVVG